MGAAPLMVCWRGQLTIVGALQTELVAQEQK